MPQPPRRRAPLLLVAALCLACAPGPPAKPAAPALDEAVLRKRCSECHTFPEPAVLPRWAWRETIADMYRTLDLSKELPQEAVVAWYEQRAPERFPLHAGDLRAAPESLKMRPRPFRPAGEPRRHSVSNVKLVDLLDDARLELTACDLVNGVVLLGRPYAPGETLEVLGRVPHPAHAEVVDLDGDGLRDLLVADLGTYYPQDHGKGSVVWLRNPGRLPFQEVALESLLGRVADVRPGDFDGDGDLDLAVAEFGYRATGSVFLLENRTTDWSLPTFVRHPVDKRHGAIHVPVADLDGDGRLDFLAVVAQEHERIVAYLNQGGLRFEIRELFRASTPSWGFSGLELVDLDRDGDLDLLATNGDSFDASGPKPYHGIQWLENQGGLRFLPHEPWPMMGVHRAETGDLDGDGDLDIVAASLVGVPPAERGQPFALESLLWLEQTAPLSFTRHTLEMSRCEHATLSVGDHDLDGDADFALGLFNWPGDPAPAEDWVVVCENRIRP